MENTTVWPRMSEQDRIRFGDKTAGTMFIPETDAFGSERVLCVASIAAYGAAGDGITNDSPAFSRAMAAVLEAGGGTIFIPRGTYLLNDPLTVPAGVCLRGEYRGPEYHDNGTLIITDYAQEGLYETPLLALESSAGVRNLAIYYLNQRFDQPLDLAPCIGFPRTEWGSFTPTVENIMVYNASYPFYFGNGHGGSEIRHLWATPLKIGMLSDRNGGIGNFIDMYMDEAYYAECGLPGAPSNADERAALHKSLRQAVSFVLERHDAPFVSRVRSHGIGTALLVRESSSPYRKIWPNGGSFGGGCYLYDFEFTGCHTGIQLENLLSISSFQVGDIVTDGSEDAVGIRITNLFHTTATFGRIAISGNPVDAVRGEFEGGVVDMLHCELKDWSGHGLTACGGNWFVNECAFGQQGNEVATDGVHALSVSHCQFVGTPELHVCGTDEDMFVFREAEGAVQISERKYYPFMDEMPGAAKCDLYDAATLGLDPTAREDCSAKLNALLKKVGENGGGTVVMPGGHYRLEAPLYVPSGVELRSRQDAAFDLSTTNVVPIFHIICGKGRTDGPAAINLAARSGLKCITLYYPEQDPDGFKEGRSYIPYPYTVRAEGEGCWAFFVCCPNSYQMMDFASAPDCSDFTICGVTGLPLRTGIVMGHNRGRGRIERCCMSLGAWTYSPILPVRPALGNSTYDAEGMNVNPVWKAFVEYYLENSDCYIFGENSEVLVYGNAAYGTGEALHFVEQDGKCTDNALIFYHSMDVTGRTIVVDKAKDLYFVSAFCNCEVAADCGARIVSYANAMNTWFPRPIIIRGGDVKLFSPMINRELDFDVFFDVSGGKLSVVGGFSMVTPRKLARITGGEVSIRGMSIYDKNARLNDRRVFSYEGNAVVEGVTNDRLLYGL